MAKTTWRKGIPLDEPLQARLRCLVREKGEKATAVLLEISEIAVLRAAAGAGLRRGTAFLVKMRLEALERQAA